MPVDPLAGPIEGDPPIMPAPAAIGVYKAIVNGTPYVVLRVATSEGVARHFIEHGPAKQIAANMQLAAGGIVTADAASITPIR